MDCGGTCMKYLLFFFNFIFFVCGAAILGVGIWVRFDPTITDYVDLTISGDNFDAATILLIVVGSFILLVGFLGCCGACQESSCMLGLFAGLMILIVLLQVVAAILGIVYQSTVENELQTHLADIMKNQVSNNSDEVVTRSVNRIQMDLRCCGVNGTGTYGTDSKIYELTQQYVPASCCKKANQDPGNPEISKADYDACSAAAQTATGDNDFVWTQGCYDGFLDFLKRHAVVVIGVCFGLAVIEILGIIFACCVRGKINDEKY